MGELLDVYCKYFENVDHFIVAPHFIYKNSALFSIAFTQNKTSIPAYYIQQLSTAIFG